MTRFLAFLVAMLSGADQMLQSLPAVLVPRLQNSRARFRKPSIFTRIHGLTLRNGSLLPQLLFPRPLQLRPLQLRPLQLRLQLRPPQLRPLHPLHLAQYVSRALTGPSSLFDCKLSAFANQMANCYFTQVYVCNESGWAGTCENMPYESNACTTFTGTV
jgi:hypothetical protein